jgi:hypothetical protein
MPPVTIDNPILNSPYREPTRHFRFDNNGQITDTVANCSGVEQRDTLTGVVMPASATGGLPSGCWSKPATWALAMSN